MAFDPALFGLLADWCVNLSAGWFGAAVILPAVSKQEINRRVRRAALVENLFFAVAFFLVAYILKRI